MGRFPWDSHRNDIPMDKPEYPATRENRRVEHTKSYVSAFHNCKNTRLHECLVEYQSIRRYANGMADTQS